jgi:predicted transcriptional regulator
MREAIAQYVAQEEKRDGLRRDTLAAWEEFRETGLHVTAEDVDQWLMSWGTEDEVPAPERHK